MTAAFEIFRSKQNATHHVAILAGATDANAVGVRASRNLTPLTSIDDARPHLGFDPDAAKAAIAAHGFYAFAVIVQPRDNFE